jgi:hypothetical protein
VSLTDALDAPDVDSFAKLVARRAGLAARAAE